MCSNDIYILFQRFAWQCGTVAGRQATLCSLLLVVRVYSSSLLLLSVVLRALFIDKSVARGIAAAAAAACPVRVHIMNGLLLLDGRREERKTKERGREREEWLTCPFFFYFLSPFFFFSSTSSLAQLVFSVETYSRCLYRG